MQTLTQRIHLEEGEEIIKVMRKHWFILLTKTIGPVILLFLPLVVYVAVGLASDVFVDILASVEPVEHVLALSIFATSFWTLLMWVGIWNGWTDYYLDMWTITNRRVIAIDQRGLFKRHIASFRYERLQDVDIEINGIIATFLDFGTLEAATAGHDDDANEFRFVGAPKPRETKAVILRAADARVRGSNYPNDDGV